MAKRGKSLNARTIFGEPPKDCPQCKRKGGVYNTRVKDGYIWRRHRCAKKHAWSSIEIYVEKETGTRLLLDNAMLDMKRTLVDRLIEVLKDERP